MEVIYIIEFSVPFDSNVIDWIQEKHTKYADPTPHCPRRPGFGIS